MSFRRKPRDPFSEVQVCLRKRDYRGALGWFDALLDQYPNSTPIRLRFADVLLLAGRKKEALKQYGLVTEALCKKGFSMRAIALHKKILKVDPGQKGVHDELLQMSRRRQDPASDVGTTTNLDEVLIHPDEPLRRWRERGDPREPLKGPSPAELEPGDPQVELVYSVETFPELSLMERVWSEFGLPEETEAASPSPGGPGPASQPREPFTGVAPRGWSTKTTVPEAQGA